jgi:hypothetical protein
MRAAPALAAARQSLDLRKALVASAPDHWTWRSDLATGHNVYGDAAESSGQRDEAAAAFREGLALWETVAANDPGSAARQAGLAKALMDVGRTGGDRASLLPRAQAILQKLEGEKQLTPERKRWLAQIEGELAVAPGQ